MPGALFSGKIFYISAKREAAVLHIFPISYIIDKL